MRHDRWASAIFCHWEACPAALQRLLPAGLVVDTHEGKAFVGTVLLSEEGISPVVPLLPGWLAAATALSHHAVNVRTYVRPASGGDGGVFFFTLDCSQILPAVGARSLFSLPYQLARMHRGGADSAHSFTSERLVGVSASVSAEWSVDDGPAQPAEAGSLAAFLVERYCLYNEAGLLLRSTVMPREAGLWVGRITHDPWPLQGARLTGWRSSMLDAVPGLPGALVDPDAAPLVLYSPGVSGIRFWWGGPLEEGASTVGEVPDRKWERVSCM